MSTTITAVDHFDDSIVVTYPHVGMYKYDFLFRKQAPKNTEPVPYRYLSSFDEITEHIKAQGKVINHNGGEYMIVEAVTSTIVRYGSRGYL